MGNFANRVREVLSRRDNSGVEIVARSVGGVTQAYEAGSGDDIFAVINDALEEAGEDGMVRVENGRYIKDNDKAVSTQLKTKAQGQTVDFQNSVVQLDDDADIDMVSLEHDGASIRDVDLRGNRQNNNINACVTSNNDPDDITIERCRTTAAPKGLYLTGLSNSKVLGSGTAIDGINADTSIHIKDCTNSIINEFDARGFDADGILIENSSSLVLSSVEIDPKSDAAPDNGIHIKGLTDSKVSGVISANGQCKKGVLDEAYDVGGEDELGSTGNLIDVNVVATTDIAYHIKDAEKERVSGLVSGDIEDGGQTSQAFLVEDANDINNPQSVIDVDATNVDRISDTVETGPNVGLDIEGHYSKVSDQATIGIGGSGSVNLRFGQAVNSPAVQILSGTQVIVQGGTKRSNTDNNGQINIDWSDIYLFEDKPILSATIEQAGQWYVASWNTDGDGNYTDVDIQVTDSSGTAVGNNVAVEAKIVGV